MSEKRLKILYISQYFYPEIGATQTRAFEMAYNLVRRGHRVTVLTEFPNHPTGLIPDTYRHRLVEYEFYRGIDVVRTWVFARPIKTFVTRMGLYLSFMIVAGFYGSFLSTKYDIVYVTSPPFFVGVTGLWLSRLKGAKFVFEIRDMWPQGAVELGELSNRRYIRWAERLERFYYRKAERIIVVTRGFQNDLQEKGIDVGKVRFIPNGTNTELFCDLGGAAKRDLGLENNFVVLYAGILGIAQGLEMVCDVIENCKVYSDIHFLFVGEGPLKSKLTEIKKAKELINLTLLSQVPRERIASYISAADCCLVPLKKIPLFKRTVPSKLFDYMACEKPVIVSVDGESRKIIEESHAGLYVEPENIENMIRAILKLKSSVRLRKKMGRAGRRFVSDRYSRRQAAVMLENVFYELF